MVTFPCCSDTPEKPCCSFSSGCGSLCDTMPPPIDSTVVTHGWDTTQIKVVLPTILLTSLVTAVITEPLKVMIQNLWKRRQIRKHVLGEVAFNFHKIWILWVSGQSTPEGMRSFIGAETERFRFIEYEAAKKEFYLFSRVPDYYSIERFYEALTYAQTECRRYLTESYVLVDNSPVRIGVNWSYGIGLEASLWHRETDYTEADS